MKANSKLNMNINIKILILYERYLNNFLGT